MGDLRVLSRKYIYITKKVKIKNFYWSWRRPFEIKTIYLYKAIKDRWKENMDENITKFEDVKKLSTEEYFRGNQFSIDAFKKKYATSPEETYVQAVKRVCDFIASVESTQELREYWSRRWFNEIFNDWWHPAGSIMQGAGSNKKISLANCTTISLGANRNDEEWDSLEAIFKNTAYTVAKCAAYRQGLGVDFSRLRPRGTKVLNSANQSTGAVHWMEFEDKIGYYVGQCLHPDTNILTEHGYKTIKEIVNINYNGNVIGKSGMVGVINWFENPPKEIFRLNLEYGDYVDASLDHKILIYDLENDTHVEKRMEEISPGDYVICKRFNGVRRFVDDVIFLPFEYRPNKYNNSNRIFIPKEIPSFLTPELSYILGIIYGDGCVHNETIEIEFSNCWPEILEKFNACIKTVFGCNVDEYGINIKVEGRNKSSGDFTKIILGSWFYAFFKHIGCLKGTSNNLEFPRAFTFCNQSNLEAFFAGLFDSDGYNTKENICLSLIDGYFLYNLKLHLQKFGYVMELRKKMQPGYEPCFNLSAVGKTSMEKISEIDSIKIQRGNLSGKWDRLKTPFRAKSLNINPNLFRDISETDPLSDSKYIKYTNSICDLYIQKVESVIKNGESITYDITVDSSDHLFCAQSILLKNSGRIPAMLFSISCDHPDVEEFIQVKSDYTKIQNANISVQCTEKFYKAVESDEDWELKFVIPPLKKGDKVYVDVHSIDMSTTREKETGKYYKIATHDRKKEVFTKTVKARQLMELIAKNMHQNAEPGIQNIDIARKYSNSDAMYDENDTYDSRIIGTNAPLTGDTLIPTPEGIIPISKLYEMGDHFVLSDTLAALPPDLIYWNYSNQTRGNYNFPTKTFPVVARFKKYENQKVWKIELNNGQVLKCNAEHRWLINGEMVTTKNIKIGDKLFKPNGGIVQACDYVTEPTSKDFREGELVGYIIGDGWVGKESNIHSKMIGIIYDADCRYYSDLFRGAFKEITGKELSYERNRGKIFEVSAENRKFVSYFEKFGIINSKYVIPPQCYTNFNFCSGFLRGLFQADGCVQWNGKQGRLALTTVSQEVANGVIMLLQNWFGIHSALKISKSKGVLYGDNKISGFRTRYDVVISTRAHLLRFGKLIGLLGSKGEVLSKIHNNCKQYNNRIFLNVLRVSETEQYEDMYCAEIKGLHAFVVSGCISSNCSEQYLSRESLCVLASINCGRFSPEREVYIKQLEKISKSVNRFLDNVNECELVYKTYATPHQELAIKKLRRTGAGVTNIAAWLFKRGLVYGSKDGNDSIEEFIKWFNYWLYVGTEELGNERGDFGLFNKDKWKNAPFVSRLIKESEKLNSEYKVPVLKGNHARNVTVSSVAPTGSISLLFRDFILSYGIEPAFFMYFWKRTRMAGKYEYYFCVPRVIKEMFAESGHPIPMECDSIRDDWKGSKGIPIAKFIDEHRSKFKFKESTEISPMDKLQLMSQVMKWIDSSISVTYMLPIGSTWKDVYNFILEAHKKEVKSIAAFPDKKMYGIVSSIPFKALALKLKEEGIGIHHQNFSDEELKELNLSRENITPKAFEYPKRLSSLDADIYVVSVKGEKFVIVVGLQNNQPYEIFGGHVNGFGFKFTNKKGKLVKIKRGQYALEIGDVVIEDFSKQFTPTEQILFRMASMAMRHGIPIQFVVEQLQKAQSDITSMGAAAARCLKKYIVDGTEITGQRCPNCGKDLVYIEGCSTCVECGHSKCG